MLAVQSKEALGHSGRFDKPIAIEIEEASVFYPAEEYHQNYHRKNPAHYKESREYSGRNAIIEKYWSN